MSAKADPEQLRQIPAPQPRQHQTEADIGGPRPDPTHITTTMPITQGTIKAGRVVGMSPYLQVYKVITGDGLPVLATPLRVGGPGQFGTVSTPTYTPGDYVLLLVHPGYPHAFIVGAMPLSRVGPVPVPDKVSLIGCDFYHSVWAPVATLLGYPDFSGRTFADACGLEQGFTANGMAFTIDPFLAQLRYDEATGLFVFAMDRTVRISGRTYEERSAAHEKTGWAASNLMCLYEGVNLKRHELLGYYYTGLDPRTSRPTDEIWAAATDCADYGQFPFHRLQEYKGALGFFKRTFLVGLPIENLNAYHAFEGKKDSSSSSSSGGDSGSSSGDEKKEIGYVGLYDEQLGIDGYYCVRSAAGFGWIKTPIISAPRRKKRINDTGLQLNDPVRSWPHDTQTGNFKAVSYALTTWDVLLHSFVWFGSQKFINGDDFVCANEKDYFEKVYQNQRWDRVMSLKGLDELQSGKFMPPPDKADLNILGLNDGKVFNSVAYIAILPDGSITIGDGYGGEIAMTGGKIFIDAPGGVFLRSGREVCVLAGSDFIATADRSIDIQAKKDTRLAAKHNLHLAGALDGGAHGVLIESRSTADDPSWFFSNDPEALGENTTIGGIRLVCPQHVIAGYAAGVHMVAHGSGYGGGEIRLEACRPAPGQPNGHIVLVGDSVNHHVDCAVVFRYPAYRQDDADPTVYFAAKDHFIVPVKQIGTEIQCNRVDQSGFDQARYNDVVTTVTSTISALHPNSFANDIPTTSYCFTFRSVNQMCTKCIELIKPRWYRLAYRLGETYDNILKESHARIRLFVPKPCGSYPGYDPTGQARPKEYDQDKTILDAYYNTAGPPPEIIESHADIPISIKHGNSIGIYGLQPCYPDMRCEQPSSG